MSPPPPREAASSRAGVFFLFLTQRPAYEMSRALANKRETTTHIGPVCSKSIICKRQADPRNSLSAWNWSKLVHLKEMQILDTRWPKLGKESKFRVFLAGSIWLSTSRLTPIHTPSFAFRHPPSKLRHNWIRPTLRISAHLSTDVASSPVKVLGTTD